MIFAPQLLQNRLLVDEFDDEEFLEFAIECYSELFGYINTGRVNIRIHMNIEGKMWFGVRCGCEPNCELNYRNRSKQGVC